LRLDEKMQRIPWTEQPTGALVGAGSLWPEERKKGGQKKARKEK
jgi:hypothetical protein